MQHEDFQLGFIFLADYGEALQGKVYAMGAGWNLLRFPQLPHPWQFNVSFALDVPWDRTNQRHPLGVHVEDPDGEVLGDPFRIEFEAGRPPGAIQGSDQRLPVALGIQTLFEKSGPHAVVVSVGETEVGRTRFYVVHMPVAAGNT